MTNRIRIHEVAAAAGVSIGTVSDALNGKGRMSDATRERVRDVAATLGYRAHPVARSLRQGRTGLIGLVIRPYSDPTTLHAGLSYFSDLLAASAAAALSTGHGVVVVPPEQLLDTDGWLPVDAMIVAEPEAADPMIAAVQSRGLPLLTDWSMAHDTSVVCIDHDNDRITRTVLDHFRSERASSVGMLASDSTSHHTRSHLATFDSWCAEHRIPGVVEKIRYAVAEPFVEGALRLLGRPDRPEAVYGIDEVAGRALLDAAGRLGLRVPDDLLLVSADDVTYATTEPPLSTVAYLPTLMARVGQELLIQRLDGTLTDVPHRLVPAHLNLRASALRTSAPRQVVIEAADAVHRP